MEQLPLNSTDLITELKKLYPFAIPTTNMTLSEIMYQAGQRSVVEFLMRIEQESGLEIS